MADSPFGIPALLPFAAGIGLSAAGGGRNQQASLQEYLDQLRAEREQMAQRTTEAQARNGVLQQYIGRQGEYGANNDATLASTLARLAPEAQAGQLATADATRDAAVEGAVGDPASYAKPTMYGAPSSVAAAYEKAIGGRVGQAKTEGKAMGHVASYGDVSGRTEGDINSGSSRIALTNDTARRDIGNLPAAQDLAGFQTQKVIRGVTPRDRSVGNLFQSLGGLLGAFSGGGSMTSSFFAPGSQNRFGVAPGATPFSASPAGASAAAGNAANGVGLGSSGTGWLY